MLARAIARAVAPALPVAIAIALARLRSRSWSQLTGWVVVIARVRAFGVGAGLAIFGARDGVLPLGLWPTRVIIAEATRSLGFLHLQHAVACPDCERYLHFKRTEFEASAESMAVDNVLGICHVADFFHDNSIAVGGTCVSEMWKESTRI